MNTKKKSITTPVTETPVEILKLSNGDEIIGRMMIHGDAIVPEDALQILQVPDRSGGISMAMIPYMRYAVEICIPNRSVVVVAKPSEELLTEYKKHFSSIITPPTSNIVVPK